MSTTRVPLGFTYTRDGNGRRVEIHDSFLAHPLVVFFNTAAEFGVHIASSPLPWWKQAEYTALVAHCVRDDEPSCCCDADCEVTWTFDDAAPDAAACRTQSLALGDDDARMAEGRGAFTDSAACYVAVWAGIVFAAIGLLKTVAWIAEALV
jgi:hypothetical protein